MRGANSFMPALLLALAIAPLSVAAHHYRRVQLGLASYYGAEFRGQETASGEIYDQHELVAAHRTLPLGSVVRVTNLENGRTVKLRIIDRGPYGRNRRKGCIIDVSTAAARRLGFIRAGLTRVRVFVVKLGDNDRSDDRDRR